MAGRCSRDLGEELDAQLAISHASPYSSRGLKEIQDGIMESVVSVSLSCISIPKKKFLS